jgi:hypothetical protein
MNHLNRVTEASCRSSRLDSISENLRRQEDSRESPKFADEQMIITYVDAVRQFAG